MNTFAGDARAEAQLHGFPAQRNHVHFTLYIPLQRGQTQLDDTRKISWRIFSTKTMAYAGRALFLMVGMSHHRGWREFTILLAARLH
jgi:hypothetical protein